MNSLRFLPFVCLLTSSALSFAEEKSGNPLFPGWYADPEGIVCDNHYWIYPTFSAPCDRQLHFDAYSSEDLVTWKKHKRILDTKSIKMTFEGVAADPPK